LICALDTDKLVAAALLRHGIPRVASDGPIWQRFPSPVSLTPAVVRELYVTCGLSTRQIELLTGQPSDTVGHRLRDIAVPLARRMVGRHFSRDGELRWPVRICLRRSDILTMHARLVDVK
jgi:hypothetical protein